MNRHRRSRPSIETLKGATRKDPRVGCAEIMSGNAGLPAFLAAVESAP